MNAFLFIYWRVVLTGLAGYWGYGIGLAIQHWLEFKWSATSRAPIPPLPRT